MQVEVAGGSLEAWWQGSRGWGEGSGHIAGTWHRGAHGVCWVEQRRGLGQSPEKHSSQGPPLLLGSLAHGGSCR